MFKFVKKIFGKNGKEVEKIKSPDENITVLTEDNAFDKEHFDGEGED